jgi:hypothetical protein
MDRRAAKARIRQAWEEEVLESEEQERQIERQLRKWKLSTALLGVAFAATCAGVVPFLAGHSLHQQWDAIGKKILLLAMGLFFPFVLVTTMYLIQWNYLRRIKKIHVTYAPPNIKYKKS